jgi:ribose 5-phosphate isomerase B
MKLYIGADHNGFALKNHLEQYLARNGYDISDVSGDVLKPTDDYPQIAAQLVTAMQTSSDADARGVLICGSGQGVCIAANRFKGIRASVCADPVAVRAGRNDDDTNVLCLPSRVVSSAEAERLVDLWLGTAFAGAARFKRRISELDELGSK